MIHLTIPHYIMIFIFIMIFALLFILSFKESNVKNRVILIILSFVVSLVGGVVSMLLLDHYTKKAKLVRYKATRAYNKKSVTITGSIKNIGKYYIKYCTMDIKIFNKIYNKNTKKVYFKTSSFSDMVKNTRYKKNFVSTSVRVVEDIKPKTTKMFKTKVEIPSEFQNLKYFFHLVCH